MKSSIISEIKDIVDFMYDTYLKEDKVVAEQPEKAVIINLVNKFQTVLFPEQFGSRHVSPQYSLGFILEDIAFELTRQITIALRYEEKYKDYTAADIKAVSSSITLEFFKKIPKIKEYLETDVQAAFDGDPAAYSKSEIIISYPGLFAIMVSRIAHELYLLSVPLIPRIMTEYAHTITGIDIHPGATIGKYFFTDHGTGIVIGETTIIGDYVKIYQGVTVGALSTRGGQMLKGVKRHPTIGDNVTIYSGASILGGETVIGDGVVIGSNAFVTKSVANETRVSIKVPELQLKLDQKNQEAIWYYII